MAIPDYQTVMLPLLRFLRDGEEHSLGEAVDAVSDHFTLSAEERQQLLPSGAPARLSATESAGPERI